MIVFTKNRIPILMLILLYTLLVFVVEERILISSPKTTTNTSFENVMNHYSTIKTTSSSSSSNRKLTVVTDDDTFYKNDNTIMKENKIYSSSNNNNNNNNNNYDDRDNNKINNDHHHKNSHEINDDNNNNNDNNNDNNNNNVRFIFAIGLEGTGHHLLNTIIKGSPIIPKLSNYNIYPNDIDILAKQLQNNNENESVGLLNAQCQGYKKIRPNVNITKLLYNVATTLQTIEQKVIIEQQQQQQQQQQVKQQDEIITIPVNTIRPLQGIGMMSYPNYNGYCRKLNYPNIDLFYKACSIANVTCDHIYIYRNPYAILKSTTIKRRYNLSILGAIHLYTTMLHIIYSQLVSYSTHTIGCFGFHDIDKSNNDESYHYHNNDNNNNNNDQKLYWKTKIRDMFGWTKTNQTGFDQFIADIYNEPSSTLSTKEEREAIVPSKHQLYMDTMLQIHENIVKLCYEQHQQRLLIDSSSSSSSSTS